jgi:hypothetical protein
MTGMVIFLVVFALLALIVWSSISMQRELGPAARRDARSRHRSGYVDNSSYGVGWSSSSFSGSDSGGSSSGDCGPSFSDSGSGGWGGGDSGGGDCGGGGGGE